MIWFYILWPTVMGLLIWRAVWLAFKISGESTKTLCDAYRNAPDAVYEEILEKRRERKS